MHDDDTTPDSTADTTPAGTVGGGGDTPATTGDDAFDRAVATMDGGVILVTTRGAGGETSGCLVGFATQCSINPRRYLVCLSDKNHTYGVARDAQHLAVHILSPSGLALARLFAEETGDEVDKFERCTWRDGPAGMPILQDAAAWFVGRIRDRVELGDHVGHVLELEAASAFADDLRPVLRFHDVRDFHPGHEA